jgi:hypothetical protein
MGKELVLIAVFIGWGCSAAHAEQRPPSLLGLARANAAEQHCGVLIATEKLELERATENRKQAEFAKSPEIAKQIFDEGMTTGAKARCDDLTSRAIKAVLRASRATPPMAANPKPVAIAGVPAKVEPVQAEVKPAMRPNRGTKPTVLLKQAKPVPSQQASNLAAYGSMVEAYYRELRCPEMSTAQVNAFYRDVMRAHQKAVQKYGMGPAATAVRRAEARANAGSC